MKQQTTSPGETSPPPIAKAPAEGVIDSATLDLIAGWRAEDATSNPDEIRAAECELVEFKRAMNENRTSAGEPLLYP
jgi:hypothetical protein